MANIKGYLSETVVTNKLLQSEDLGTTWAIIDAGDTIGGSVEAPNNTTNTTAGIIGDSTDGPHGVSQATANLTAATWTFSVFAKVGDQSFLKLENSTIANGAVWFDLSGGTVETTEAGIILAAIEDWGDGWFRCMMSFTGTVAAHTFRISPADGDNDSNFVGDGATVNFFAWGTQCELGEYMSSYVPTITGEVTRNKDELKYKGDDGNLGGVGSELMGTLVINMLTEDYNQETAINSLVAISDGGTVADYLILWSRGANDNAAAATTNSSGDNGNINTSSEISDNIVHNLRMSWKTDNLNLYVDAVGFSDITVDPPDDLDEIDVGHRFGLIQAKSLISNLRIFKRSTRK